VSLDSIWVVVVEDEESSLIIDEHHLFFKLQNIKFQNFIFII